MEETLDELELVCNDRPAAELASLLKANLFDLHAFRSILVHLTTRMRYFSTLKMLFGERFSLEPLQVLEADLLQIYASQR